MSKWKTVRLGDVCILEKGQQIDTSLLDDSKTYRYINGGIKETGYFDKFNTSGESVLISEGGASCGYINYVNEDIWCGCHCYRLHDIKVFPKYLFHALKANQQRIMALRTGSAMPNIQKSTIQKFQLKIHDDLTTQKNISTMLDKCNELIEKYKKMLEKYDTLIKSRFIEMFGDPDTNPKGWEIVPFSEVIEYMGDIGSNGANQTIVAHLDMTSTENYALMVRFLNFTNNDFTNDVKYISEANYNFFKKSKIYGGELIFCKIGSAGLNYIMPFLNRPVSLGLNQIMTRVNDKIKMAYLYQYLNSDYGKYLISQRVQGAVTKSITKTALKEMPIVLPPLSLQNQFAAFVQQIDKSKFAVQKSLEKAETLYKSLMQKYFN